MNTEHKRDEIRRQKNKPPYSNSPWFEKELLEALNVIDRLEKDHKKELKACKESTFAAELQRIRIIEQRTKKEMWAKVGRKAGTHLYLSLKQIREVIEEVGEK